MKKIILILLIITSFSCNKLNKIVETEMSKSINIHDEVTIKDINQQGIVTCQYYYSYKNMHTYQVRYKQDGKYEETCFFKEELIKNQEK